VHFSRSRVFSSLTVFAFARKLRGMAKAETPLRTLRRQLGINQTRLAELSGLNQQHLSRIENGEIQDPSHRAVTCIVRGLRKAGAVGVTAEDVFPVACVVGDDQ
jgi:predicted transcriptional regulator